ncbi:PhoH family protein [Bacillus smithii]|uniref:PhoH family protein n=1 Tax=Bacillus smithii TaxID=1479 RepID=UPI002E251E68|nr:PhoH family protein [Bacillus smithii]MED4928961.1 PhoH family protein [Bacillus smithii]
MPLPKDNLFFGYANKLTKEQKEYVDSIFDNQFTIVNAKAGTGKTTLAVMAAKVLQRELIYVFSPVEEKSLGYTPGTVEEKEEKYIVPLKDALLEMNEDPSKAIISEEKIDNLKNGNAWVKAMSHVFARGTNIKGNKILIIDEAQNFTRGELKKILTRVHDEVKVVMIGHDGQIDLKDPKKSGFIPYLEHFKNEPYAKVCTLTKNFRGHLANHADELKW